VKKKIITQTASCRNTGNQRQETKANTTKRDITIIFFIFFSCKSYHSEVLSLYATTLYMKIIVETKGFFNNNRAKTRILLKQNQFRILASFNGSKPGMNSSQTRNSITMFKLSY
jgi:hypothetical protein